MTEFDRDAYITTGRAARLLGVHGGTVLRWIKSGKLPALTTPGGQHLILKTDLDKVRPTPTQN